MESCRINDLDVNGKTVLMRVDFNVPQTPDGRIDDDGRIRGALLSITHVLNRGGRLILMSHLGRPDGSPAEMRRYSLRGVAERLGELLGQNVHFATDTVGDDARDKAAALNHGEVLLLENLRFHPGETKGDIEFARALAALGEIYCNEAFGTCHRSDASMAAVPQAMVGKPKVAGFLLDQECRFIAAEFEKPQRPFVVLLGGAKVPGKLDSVADLMRASICDRVLTGGIVANTLLCARGVNVGASKVSRDRLDLAKELLDTFGNRIVLPVDACGAVADTGGCATWELVHGGMPTDAAILDIGPQTVRLFADEIGQAKTIVWNGPLGVFEQPPFHEGTTAIARAVAGRDALTVIGGGEVGAALEQLGLSDRITHVSTGGGALLALVARQRCPALDLLDTR